MLRADPRGRHVRSATRLQRSPCERAFAAGIAISTATFDATRRLAEDRYVRAAPPKRWMFSAPSRLHVSSMRRGPHRERRLNCKIRWPKRLAVVERPEDEIAAARGLLPSRPARCYAPVAKPPRGCRHDRTLAES